MAGWKRMLGAMLVLIGFVVAHMTYLAQDRLPGLLPHLLRPPAARWSRAAAAAAAAAGAAASAIVPHPSAAPGAGARSPIDFVFNPSRLNLPAEAEQSDATVTMAGVCDKRGMMNWPVCKDWLKRWEKRFPERPVAVGEHMEAVFLGAPGGAAAARAAAAAAAPQQPPPPPPPPPAAPEDEAPLTLAGEHAGERTGTDVFALAPHAAAADGDHADLDGHRGNEQCWRHFDLGFLEDWDAAARMMCTPTGGQWEGVEGEASAKLGPPYSAAAPAGSGAARLPSAELAAALAAPAASAPPGWLRCRVISDAHLPGPTAPHTLCDGANVYLFPARLSPTTCLPSRPGYKCAGPPIHWAYAPGALAAACDAVRPALSPEAFPRDHLRDMFGSWGAGGLAEALAAGGEGSIEEAGGEFVLLVAREREEHANAFHATTDWLNAYIALALAGVVDARTGRDSASGGGMARVQVLLLDEQSGPFEDAWYGRVLSRGAHPVLRVSALQARGVRALRMRRALFVPPGYTNMLLSHVASEGDCHAGTALLQGYRAFVLAGLGLAPLPLPPSARGGAGAGAGTGAGAGGEGGASGAGAPLRVLLISRRPYSAAGIEHGFVGRQIDNEDSLLTGLRQALDGAGLARGAEVERLDLALLDAREQAAALALRCDVLLGMHGAALTYTALLPPWAGVVELWPKQSDIWRCFEHLAAMAGLFYERWENGDWGAWREDASGDYTRVDVGAVAAKVIAAARHAEAWQAPVG